MDRVLLSVLVTFLSTVATAQTVEIEIFSYDEIDNHPDVELHFDDSLWQVGPTSKLIGAGALGSVVITDTAAPYPANADAACSVRLLLPNYLGSNITDSLWIFLSSSIDSDTLVDYGNIELVLDNGNLVLDLLRDSTYVKRSIYVGGQAVNNTAYTVSGSANFDFGFLIDLGSLLLDSLSFAHSDADFRFTFVSDSIDTGKDGWMLSNYLGFIIYLSPLAIGETATGNEEWSVFPNPTDGIVHLDLKNYDLASQEVVEVFDASGRRVMSEVISALSPTIDLGGLKNGVYYLSLSSDHKRHAARIQVVK